jgi:hypothetical protein
LNELKEENSRLKTAIVNKDNDCSTLRQILDKEKERREQETSDVKKMMMHEVERGIKAIRESE